MKRRVGSGGFWLLFVGLVLASLSSCGHGGDTAFFTDAGTAGAAGASASSGGSDANGGSRNSGGSSSAGRGGRGGAPAGGSAGSDGGASGGSSGNGGSAGSNAGGAGNGGSAGSNTGGAGTGGSAGGSAGTAGASGSAGTGGMGGSAGMGPEEVYVGPNGNDTNPGTLAQPFATVGKGQVVARPGTTIWILPGAYSVNSKINLTKDGTLADPIRLYAVAGPRPVFDFSGQARNGTMRGIEVNADFWHIRGIEIDSAGDNGILITGSNNVIENVIVHGCEDTGIQITVPDASALDPTLGANNWILNCDSYLNFDTLTGGENADGFAAKLRIGAANVFRGCRAWYNADDGFDFFAADDIVIVQDSWSFLNGFLASGTAAPGDGNGFKLGGQPNGTGQGDAAHIVGGCAAFENRSCGYNKNNNALDPQISQSFANANASACCGGANCSDVSGMTMTGFQGMTAVRNADGSLPPIN